MIKYLCYSLLLINTSVLAIERVVTSSTSEDIEKATFSSHQVNVLGQNTVHNYRYNSVFSPFNLDNPHLYNNHFVQWSFTPTSHLVLSHRVNVYSQDKILANTKRLELNVNESDNSIASAVNVSFQSGKFSVDVGFFSKLDDSINSPRVYTQLGYSFIEEANYSVVGIARVDNINNQLTENFENAFIHQGDIKNFTSTNTTLGVLGTYKVSPKLTIMGSFTTTTIGSELTDNKLFDYESDNHALVGASYSF